MKHIIFFKTNSNKKFLFAKTSAFLIIILSLIFLTISLAKESQKSGMILTDPLIWENDVEFLDKMKKNKFIYRMVSFKTVLRNPLPGEEYNVNIGASRIAGIILNPNEVFSQNEFLGPYTVEKGFKSGPTYSGEDVVTTIGGGVCKLASTLYNLAILCNLEVVERYNHSFMVPYVPLGQDATVFYGSKDFKFRNNTKYPIMIWAKSEGNILYMALYGKEKPPVVQWHHEIINSQPSYFQKKVNPSLTKGQEKIIYEGYNGYSVKNWITIEYSNGKTETKSLGLDYYKVFPGLMEIGI